MGPPPDQRAWGYGPHQAAEKDEDEKPQLIQGLADMPEVKWLQLVMPSQVGQAFLHGLTEVEFILNKLITGVHEKKREVADQQKEVDDLSSQEEAAERNAAEEGERNATMAARCDVLDERNMQLMQEKAMLETTVAELERQLMQRGVQDTAELDGQAQSSNSSSVQLPVTPCIPAEGAVSGLSHDVAVAVAAEQRTKGMPHVRKAVRAALRLGAAAMRHVFVCGSLAVQEHEP